jgi:DNA-binding NtrC family response regulator
MDRDAAPFFVRERDGPGTGAEGSMKSPRDGSPHASDRARRRRKAAEQRAQAARVLVCEVRDDAASPFVATVRSLGYETIACTTLADALREAAAAPFDVVLAALPTVAAEQGKLLQVLRRSIPGTPLVVVSDDGSLEARRHTQGARPYYFAVPPLSESELRAILSGAVEAADRR